MIIKPKFTTISYSLLLFFFSVANLHAQQKTFPLWPDKIPGELKNTEYQEKATYKDSVLLSTSQVTIPTLTIYQPTNANGTSIIICPGGGYGHLAMEKEGKKVAEWLNSLGITAFVLKYRLPNDKIMADKNIGPLQDVQEAIRTVRRKASEWKLDENKIGILGFSAGGHLAATASTHFNEKVYGNDSTSARPDFSLLIYPVISMKNEITHKGSQTNLLGKNPSDESINRFSNELAVTSETPPTFLIHATDDKTVAVENSINYYLALKKNSIPAELHIYEKGGHGFGLGVKNTSQFWTSNCIQWLKDHKYL